MKTKVTKMPKIGTTVKVTNNYGDKEFNALVIDHCVNKKAFQCEITVDGFTDTYTIKLAADERDTLEFSWDFEEVDSGQVEAQVECSHAAEISPFFHELPRDMSITDIRKIVKKFAKENNLIFTEITVKDTGRAYSEAKLNAYHNR